jgi:hypothetical protein
VARDWDKDLGLVSQAFLEHTFVVENRGEELLEIRHAQVPCQCMNVEYGPHVLPGGSTEIRVFYDARERSDGPFARHVVLGTNDPENPRLVLRLRGFAAKHVQVFPVLPGLFLQCFRGESLGQSFVLHSELHPGFKPGKPETSTPHLVAKLEAVTENFKKVDSGLLQFPNVIARKGDYVLSIKTSAEAPEGEYRRQWVRVPTGVAEQPVIEFLVDAFVQPIPH